MNEFLNNNKRVILIVALVAVVIGGVVVYYGGTKNAKRAIFNNERVINESPVPRTLESASAVDGRQVVSTGEKIALVSDKQVIIEGGKTLKEGYFIAEPEALIWAPDAKLVYIRSLGTVTVDGISSGWEIVFGSKSKNKGYMFAVISGVITDKKEVTSKSSGYPLPTNWYDAGEAFKSIRTLAQFKDSTISGLNFYYNEDGKRWGYAISSSNGTVSVPVR